MRSAQSCLTLCNPIDCSLPDTSTYGIFQARILSRLLFPSLGISRPKDQTCISHVSVLAGRFFTHCSTMHTMASWELFRSSAELRRGRETQATCEAFPNRK